MARVSAKQEDRVRVWNGSTSVAYTNGGEGLVLWNRGRSLPLFSASTKTSLRRSSCFRGFPDLVTEVATSTTAVCSRNGSAGSLTMRSGRMEQLSLS